MTTAEQQLTESLRRALDTIARERQAETSVRTNTAERVWLTVDQAARYLGLPSARALYQAVRRGRFPAHRMGRSLKFNRAELDEALHRG